MPPAELPALVRRACSDDAAFMGRDGTTAAPDDNECIEIRSRAGRVSGQIQRIRSARAGS